MFRRRAAKRGSGVVHQNISYREIACDLPDQAIERPAICEVAGIGCELPAQGDHRQFDFAARGFQRRAHADDVGPGLCQRNRQGPADAAPATGDEGDLASEVEGAFYLSL
jgi:hypothetical protein